MSKKSINRIGEVKTMNCGELATIIEYNNRNDIIVEFKEYNEKIRTTYANFTKLNIKSKFAKCTYGIGYLGIGKYKASHNKKDTLVYKYWERMLERCYSMRFHENNPTYESCSVCEEWHNFQNFAKWFEENYYECNGEIMQLDKDILCKGNKVYSPDTCVFVPKRINTLFIKCDKVRGDYPVGVNYYKKYDNFIARCNTLEKRVNLGYFDTPEEAFYIYREFKEKYIKKVADEYKDKIPLKLYNAMYEYIVEIND